MKKRRNLGTDFTTSKDYRRDLGEACTIAVRSITICEIQGKAHCYFRGEDGRPHEFYQASTAAFAEKRHTGRDDVYWSNFRNRVADLLHKRPEYRHLLVRSKLRAGRSNYTTPTRKTGDWL